MKKKLSEQGREVMESIKSSLHDRIQEWLGFDIPSEGDEDYDTWQQNVAEVDAIESFNDVLNYIECESWDLADFFICGDWDLSSLSLKPGDLPPEIISEFGNNIASQSWKGGSWSNVYEYSCLYLAQDEVEGIVFDNAKDAFKRAGIGRSTYDEILHIDVDSDYEYLVGQVKETIIGPKLTINNPSNIVEVDEPDSSQSLNLEIPERSPQEAKLDLAILLIIPNWPGGTMAFKFGSAMKKALNVNNDSIKLVQMSPERIFRAETNVTESEFRKRLSSSGVPVPRKIHFVEL